MASSNPEFNRTDAPSFGGLNLAGHVTTLGATIVTAAAGANNGGSPPAPVVGRSSDESGTVTFGSGTIPAAGAQCVVTFNSPFQIAPVVLLTPGNTATQALGLYVSAVTTTGFTISTTSAPAASQANTVYSVNFMVIG